MSYLGTPPVLDFEAHVSGLPEVAKTWLRAHPEYWTDPDQYRQLEVAHSYVTEIKRLTVFSKEYFGELEARLASSRKYSSAELCLAVSLVAYVFRDDAKLPRDQFLRLVIDRIVDDLGAPLTLARPDEPARRAGWPNGSMQSAAR
jgi:hypothetical protein